jgi:hypothetical protein
VCPHCGTRAAEWDDDEEAYVASAQLCSGCEAIADKQADIPSDKHGVKVGLVPYAVHAAHQAAQDLKRQSRRPRPWDTADQQQQ